LYFVDFPEQMKIDNELMTPCVFVTPHGLSWDMLYSLWEKIALTDAKRDVLEALHIIEPALEDFAVISHKGETPRCRLRLRGSNKTIPAKVLGDGMNRLIGLSMALVCSKGGILLVDEIENGIHWSVLPTVWKFIIKVAKRLNVQVFATTHSNDCLRAFHSGTKGDPQLQGVAVRLEKRDNEFRAEIFDEQRLAVIVKEGIEIR
jgi:predicted ATPase